MKDFKLTPEIPKGWLFEIDSEEQRQPSQKRLVNRDEDQVKAFPGTDAQTQGPRGTAFSVVLENVRRILVALAYIRSLFLKNPTAIRCL